jgi:two-component system sensor histidine kinase KdpD
MDLDAAAGRRPAVALVDELAHTNVPGSRHEKRWQDVEELLDAGIDVISTVNIQHLESLNDVVESITGWCSRRRFPTRWRAGRPDRAGRHVAGGAAPPDGARQHLHAEKVDAALANYFRVGNLSALRELALLWLADRVDEGLGGTAPTTASTRPGRRVSGSSSRSPAARRARPCCAAARGSPRAAQAASCWRSTSLAPTG